MVAAIVVAIAACVAIALAFGAWRWRRGTARLRVALDAARVARARSGIDVEALAALPDPVRRYFRLSLADGQRIVATATLRHTGTFDVGPRVPRWRTFTSEQRVVTRRRGFDWDARVMVVPGVAMRVHDAYVGGEGVLQASIAGVATVMHLRGGGDIARGELMRFVAEAAWYPTALLPCEGVRWEAVDARSARAIVRDGDVEVSLVFGFDARFAIETVYAEARGRTVAGDVVPTPWQGRFWNAERRDGMLVPQDGEVAWLLPDGPRPYWRGHLVSVAYEYDG